jgi:signal transduction histidine kinase
VVWTKAKSAFTCHEIPAAADLLSALPRRGGIRLLAGDGGPGAAPPPLRSLLDYHGGPVAASLLCAPLHFEGELLGVLKLASLRRPSFDGHDAKVVERFLPAATVSLRNARVNRGLEDRALQAEIRAGLAVLARAVAHDVNNALGAILPVAQQLRADAAAARLDPAAVASDLDVIVDNALLCRRIFSNMLRLGAEPAAAGPLDVNRALADLEPILAAQARPRAIELVFDLAPALPAARMARPHFERIAWNLVTNAAEALGGSAGAAGLRVVVATRAAPDGVVFTVADNGPGIPPERLARVSEPFFTTKADGTGLGLAICRSLAWQSGGRLEIASEPGQGTRVEVHLPAAAATEAAPAGGGAP